MRCFLPFLLAIASLLLPTAPARAQAAAGSGRLVGVVKDRTGAVVPAGTVEIRGLDSALVLTAVTDAEGRYAFDALPAGRYPVSASRRGSSGRCARTSSSPPTRAPSPTSRSTSPPAGPFVEVTAPAGARPLVVETDPRTPRQPIPAHDGADYLKTIPGFSVIRKGGTDGDPVLRGMAGSRLGVLLDGEHVLGGCGNRMDPPTAYAFPEAYDRITVLKGPADGAPRARATPRASCCSSAARARSRRPGDPRVRVADARQLRTQRPGRRTSRPALAPGLRAGRRHPLGHGRLRGRRRPGRPLRATSAGAPTPPSAGPRTRRTRARALGRAQRRRGRLRRPHDGRRRVRPRERRPALRAQRNISRIVQGLEGQAYYNYVDHVMDNYSLRTFTPSTMMPDPVGVEPRPAHGRGPRLRRRLEFGSRDAGRRWAATGRSNRHSVRSSSNQPADPYEAHERMRDAALRERWGLRRADAGRGRAGRIVAGAASTGGPGKDERQSVPVGMGMRPAMPNPTAGLQPRARRCRAASPATSASSGRRRRSTPASATPSARRTTGSWSARRAPTP